MVILESYGWRFNASVLQFDRAQVSGRWQLPLGLNNLKRDVQLRLNFFNITGTDSTATIRTNADVPPALTDMTLSAVSGPAVWMDLQGDPEHGLQHDRSRTNGYRRVTCKISWGAVDASKAKPHGYVTRKRTARTPSQSGFARELYSGDAERFGESA